MQYGDTTYISANIRAEASHGILQELMSPTEGQKKKPHHRQHLQGIDITGRDDAHHWRWMYAMLQAMRKAGLFGSADEVGSTYISSKSSPSPLFPVR